MTDKLTPREAEIKRLLLAGLHKQDVADCLYIALETVRSHVKHLLAKEGHCSVMAMRFSEGLKERDAKIAQLQAALKDAEYDAKRA